MDLRRLLLLSLLWGGCTPAVVRQGEALLAQGRYDDAVAHYEHALAGRSTDAARDGLAEARHQRAAARTQGARAALAADDATAAFEMLSEALEDDPDAQDALTALDEARVAVLADALRAEARGQPEEALRGFELVLSQYRRDEEARAGAARSRQAVATGRYEAAQARAERHPGAALALYLAADAVDPGATDALLRARALLAGLRAEAHADLGVDVSAARGVEVDGRAWRADVEAALSQRGWPVTVRTGAARAPGDLQLTARLDALQVAASQERARVTRRVEDASAQRPNPARAPAEAEVAAATQRADAARAALTDSETRWRLARERLLEAPGAPRALEEEGAARQAHASARSALSQALAARDAAVAARDALPPMLGEVKVQEATQEVVTARISGQLRLWGRCVAVGDAPVDVPLAVDARPSFEDQGADALPALGIPADPLEIPTRDALTATLTAQARQAVVDTALACREAQVADRWASARRLVADGWTDAAADALLRAWLSAPAQDDAEVKAWLVGQLGAPPEALGALLAEGG